MNARTRPTRHESGIQSVSVVRTQAAFVRSLLDEIDRASPVNLERAVGTQVVEELTRLGCRCMELASELSRVVDEAERPLRPNAD